jgi:hypothetical protein
MKKIYEDIKNVLESKISTRVLSATGIILVAMIIFSAGIVVGSHKASFGHAWEENYEKNFGMGPNRPIFGRDNFPNAHGTTGKIIKIELPTIIVQDKNNVEKAVLLTDDTKIQKMMDTVETKDLSVDDYVIVIGSPNEQGQIEAKFIRVMPSPELMPAPKVLSQ